MQGVKPRKVALLTAGGLAPCLSSAIGGLIERYTEIAPEIEIICYRGGYKGLLLGDHYRVTPEIRAAAPHPAPPRRQPDRQQPGEAHQCQGLREARPGQGGPESAAGGRRPAGAGTASTCSTRSAATTPNTAAADLAAFLAKNGYDLTVIGLPKTIDNDVYPIRQSLGAWTAAEQGARYFANVVAEHGANPRMLIVHEVMGRNCGWLTAATARAYRERLLGRLDFVPGLGLAPERLDVHGDLPARDADRPRRRGRAAKAGHGPPGQRQPLHFRGRRRGGDRRGADGQGARGPPRRLRPRQARRRQPGQMVRRAVRQESSARRRRSCRKAATSPAPRRPTPRTCA